MERSTIFWLLSLSLFLVFLALEPLLGFALFGSDTGEYFRLTSILVSTGHIPLGSAYQGWGSSGYQDFPGMFLLGGSVSVGTGIDVLTALSYVVPVVAVLSVVPLFLLFRRLFNNDTIAILGAGFASVAMPRLFSIAHPAPLALGDFLVVGALWMFLEGRTDRRWYLPLGLTAGALIATHHLSSFFFVVGSIGSLVLMELARPGAWSRRFPLRELVFIGGFLVVLWSYWIEYAVAFRPIIFQSFPHALASTAAAHPGYVLAGLSVASIGLVALVGGILDWRRAHTTLQAPSLKFPPDRAYGIELAAFFVVLFLGISVLVFLPIPGTSQTASPFTILFITPLLIAIAFSAGSRRMLSTSRIGGFATAWVGALTLGILFAVALIVSVGISQSNASAQGLAPGRFAEYVLIPLGLLIAVGLGRLASRARHAGGTHAMIALGVGVVVLLSVNAAIAYPPPSVFGGFQEGLTHQDAALWLWIGIGLPPAAVVASDHRLSSMIFGFDGNRATWDSTPSLFTGKNRAAAFAELNSSLAPHSYFPISAVVVDSVMYGGVALDPGANALPLSVAAQAWFSAPPFVPLYVNGQAIVYWVDGPPA